MSTYATRASPHRRKSFTRPNRGRYADSVIVPGPVVAAPAVVPAGAVVPAPVFTPPAVVPATAPVVVPPLVPQVVTAAPPVIATPPLVTNTPFITNPPVVTTPAVAAPLPPVVLAASRKRVCAHCGGYYYGGK